MERETINIMAVGDCNTCGSLELGPGESMPAQFCRMLAADGVDARLLNLGYTMCTTREGLARLRAEGLRIPPAIVLINFGLVDAWVTTIPGIYVPYYPDNRLRKTLRKLLKSLKRRLRTSWLKEFVPWGEVVSPVEYRLNLEAMITEIRHVSPHARIVLWGTPPSRDDEERNRNLQRYDTCLRQIAEATDTAFVDVAEAIREAADTASLYIDNVHLSASGATLVAKRIHQVCGGP